MIRLITIAKSIHNAYRREFRQILNIISPYPYSEVELLVWIADTWTVPRAWSSWRLAAVFSVPENRNVQKKKNALQNACHRRVPAKTKDVRLQDVG